VGNGPSVLKRELADKVDSHDIVIRCNQYRVAGYEKYIGTKVDIWAMETKCFAMSGFVKQEGLVMPGSHYYISKEFEKELAHRFKEAPEVWLIPSISYFKICHGSVEKLTKQIKPLRDNFHIFSLQDIIEVSHAMWNAFPSTGAVCATWAARLFETPVDIIGFDHFKGMPGGYWETEWLDPNPHDSLREEAYIAQLVKQKKIKIL